MAEQRGRSADPGVLASASVERVQAALRAAGSASSVVVLERSARSAAKAVGAPEGAIVKTLVLPGDDRPFLALVAGDRRCDEAAVARRLGAARVTRPDAAVVREATGFAIGGWHRSGCRGACRCWSTSRSGGSRPSGPRPGTRTRCSRRHRTRCSACAAASAARISRPVEPHRSSTVDRRPGEHG